MLTINETIRPAHVPDTCARSAPVLGSASSDNALIEAIARGDRYAMTLLYGRHSVRVYRFARRFVADEAAAEDLVNEVFFEVWRKAGAFRGASQVSTWLLSITRNKGIET